MHGIPSPSAPPVAPSPEPAGGADAGDESDSVAAAAAAAADAAGPADTSIPVAGDEQARRDEWSRGFAAKYGAKIPGVGDIAGGAATIGAGIAAAEWAGISQGLAVAGRKRNPPVYIVVDPSTVAAILAPLADAWDEQLRRWGLSLAGVEPWMVLLGAPVALVTICMAGMTTTPPNAESQPGAAS